MEQPPKVSKDEMVKALVNMSSLSEQMTILVQTVNDNYEYWDSVKYKALPQGYTPNDLWRLVVAERQRSDIKVWNRYRIHFSLTNNMQQQCHYFDMNFGGSWGTVSLIQDAYLHPLDNAHAECTKKRVTLS